MSATYRTTSLFTAALLAASCAFAQISAKLTASAADLQAKYGTSKVKIVFTSDNAMYYVDFSEATPSIRKMTGVTGAYYPVISEDGKKVAFQTGNIYEGPYVGTLTAKVWMRDIAEAGAPTKVADTGYVPRFVQNTPAETPEIIYATGLNCPAGICYTAGSTVKRKIVGNVPQAPEKVFGGNYYGGISWDNRYLVTAWEGGPNVFMQDLDHPANPPSKIHTIAVKKDGTNADTTVELGACNISRSASRIFTNTVLYFDFGSNALKTAHTHHPLLGNWNPHEKIFLSAYGAQDLKVFDMPADRKVVSTDVATGAGEAVGKAWNNPEWSNHPYFAIATLAIDRLFNVSGNYKHNIKMESIYLINLKDSSYVKLLETTDSSLTTKTDIQTPFAWVEVPAGFQEDNAWLSKTIWGNLSGVKQSAPQRNARFSPDMLSFDKSVTGINIYTCLGVKLASVDPAGKTASDFRRIFSGLNPGIYFIGLEAKGEKQTVVQWLKTN